MFLIKLVTERYSFGGVTEQVIGYAPTEELAIKYCEKETPKLKYNKNMGNKYYIYTEIADVYNDSIEFPNTNNKVLPSESKRINDIFKRNRIK